MTLALVRDMRELREPSSANEVADFETDVLAGFVLARVSAGLADSTIRIDTGHLELIRSWFGRPLWEMQPEDADAYFGRVLRDAKPSTRTGRVAALTVYFQFGHGGAARHDDHVLPAWPGTCLPDDSAGVESEEGGSHQHHEDSAQQHRLHAPHDGGGHPAAA